jgi:hypothetical protein
MPESQLAIVRQAERLAANLDGGPVKVGKNVLLALVADFVSTPRPDRDRLRRLLKLVQAESGGHVKRGGGYGEQLRLAAREVAGALADDLSDRDLKSLFGWTARLLRNRQDDTPALEREAARPFTAARSPRRDAPPPPAPPPAAPAAPKTSKPWDNVQLGRHNGSPAVFRGKEVATCPQDVLPAELLAAFKALNKKTELRCNVEVVKALGALRVVRIIEWRKVEK